MGEQVRFLTTIKWAYTLYWGERGISSLLFFLLAGLLGPRDFGIMAIATVYISGFQLFLDQGLASAIIQRNELDDEHLSSAFWFNIFLSIILVALSVGFSREWAIFNHTPELQNMVCVLSICVFIEGLSIVQTAILRRQLNFRGLSIRVNSATSAGAVVGLAMAFHGFGAWSLVGQQLARDIAALILLTRISSWRPTFKFSLRKLADLLNFSIPNFFGRLAGFFEGQMASIVLGAFFGPVPVGLYRLADKAVVTVIGLSRGSIISASFPLFSRLQTMPAQFRNSVLTSVHMGAIVSLPPLAGLAMISGPLLAKFGASWLPATQALEVLCIAGMMQIFGDFTGPVLQALGRPRQSAVLDWSTSLAAIATLLAAGFIVRDNSVQAQVLGMSVARLAMAFFLTVPMYAFLLVRVTNISALKFLGAVLPSAIASVAVALAVDLIRFLGLGATFGPTVTLVGEVASGAVAGIGFLLLMDSKVRSLVGPIRDEFFGRLSTRPRKP